MKKLNKYQQLMHSAIFCLQSCDIQYPHICLTVCKPSCLSTKTPVLFRNPSCRSASTASQIADLRELEASSVRNAKLNLSQSPKVNATPKWAASGLRSFFLAMYAYQFRFQVKYFLDQTLIRVKVIKSDQRLDLKHRLLLVLTM